MKLVFASNNEHKLKEIRSMMPREIEIISLKELGHKKELAETENTLLKNALQKAKYIFQKYHVNCFADDSGLEVEALKGEPSVNSARYAGENKNADANIKKLLHEMRNESNRKAKFKTIIAAIINGNEIICEGIVKGEILREKRGAGGFGYDPVFKPSGHNLTFAEMLEEEKNKISHRAKALQKFKAALKKMQ